MTINDYTTLTEVWASLPDVTRDSNLDTFITRLITDASRAIDKFTKRKPGAYYVTTDDTVYFDGYGISNEVYYPYGVPTNNRNRGIDNNVLRVGEILSVTSIALSLSGSVNSYDTALASTDYYLSPYNNPVEGKPYTHIVLDVINGNYAVWPAYPKSIKIVGKFGYSTAIPGFVRQAVIMQVGRWYQRGKQAYQNSMSIGNPENSITYTDRLDTEIEKLLKNFSKLAI